MEPAQPQQDVLTVQDAADRARISAGYLFQLIRRGDGPPTVKIGRRIVIRKTSFDEWLQSLEVAGGGASPG